MTAQLIPLYCSPGSVVKASNIKAEREGTLLTDGDSDMSVKIRLKTCVYKLSHPLAKNGGMLLAS